MVDEVIGHEQKSIDRARTLSHNLMRRSMAELRKLQTERTLRVNLNFDRDDAPGLTETKQVLQGVKAHDGNRPRVRKPSQSDLIDALIAKASETEEPDLTSFCKSTPQAGNSAQAASLQASPTPPTPEDTSFCESTSNPGHAAQAASAESPRTAQTPRNAPCPCRSGQKYKRCCGRTGEKWSALPILPPPPSNDQLLADQR